MSTHQFQESTVAAIKHIANAHTASFLNELSAVNKQAPNDHTKVVLSHYVTAAIMRSVAEGNSYDEMVGHLADTLTADKMPPLSTEAAITFAGSLLRPVEDELLTITTNPDDFSLGDDKNIIRNAVINRNSTERKFAVENPIIPIEDLRDSMSDNIGYGSSIQNYCTLVQSQPDLSLDDIPNIIPGR